MATLLDNWKSVLTTQNLPAGREMDLVSKWLIIVRASVFPMTITSGAIGGLLVVAGPQPARPAFGLFALALAGIVVAHAANNMINDYFDLQSGVDSAEYVRGQYAPHPILSGLISRGGLLAAIGVANAIDLAILVKLYQERGWPVIAFALAGLFISVFYVAPPFRLKHRGLGEPGVAFVWGPLMTAGTYYVTAGQLPAWVWVASLPYALVVTAVLVGKHIDKHDADAAKGIRTLPVILGKERSLFLNQTLFVSFYLAVLMLVLTGTLGVFTLLVFAALPRTVQVMKVHAQPKPTEKPENYPIWPLWYVAWSFLATRMAGGFFVLGLVLNAIWPVFL